MLVNLLHRELALEADKPVSTEKLELLNFSMEKLKRIIDFLSIESGLPFEFHLKKFRRRLID